MIDNEYVELKNDDEYRENKGDTSPAMFMSGHFVFPPSEHENLPIEPDISRTQKEHAGNYFLSDSDTEHSHVPERFSGTQPFDSKGKSAEFEEGRNMQGLTSDKEQSMYNAERSLDYALVTSEPDEEYEYDGLPCGAWWKRSANFLYAHAKETNSFWSIFIAATVMGLVILGHRWQQESSLTASAEKMGWMLSPIYRLKDVIVGVYVHLRGSFIKHAHPSSS